MSDVGRAQFYSVGHDYQLSCCSQSVLKDPGCKVCH